MAWPPSFPPTSWWSGSRPTTLSRTCSASYPFSPRPNRPPTSAFRVRIGGGGAHVNAVAHQFLAVLEHGLEVVEARPAAVIDVDVHRRADRQNVLAENVFLPAAAVDVRRIEVRDRVLGFVDHLHMAILGVRRGGGQADQCE